MAIFPPPRRAIRPRQSAENLPFPPEPAASTQPHEPMSLRFPDLPDNNRKPPGNARQTARQDRHLHIRPQSLSPARATANRQAAAAKQSHPRTSPLQIGALQSPPDSIRRSTPKPPPLPAKALATPVFAQNVPPPPGACIPCLYS